MVQRPDIVKLVDQYQIMASVGRYLPAFCAPLGIDLEAIAKSLQIDVAGFEDFGARISFDRFCRLLEALASITGNDVFGLQYGLTTKSDDTGPFSMGLAKAPNFKEMLRFYARFVHVVADIEYFNTAIEGDRISVTWTYSPLMTQREQYVDYSASAIMRLFELFAGGPINLVHAQLERRPPRDKTMHARIFSRNIKFNADVNEIILPASVLKSVNPQADNAIFRYMTQQCEGISAGMVRRRGSSWKIST